MKTSICMCTYNGEAFIEKQLLTIYEQTLKPDEVIISDDCSSDRTVSIIESFIKERGLEGSWKLIRNSENAGYLPNFYNTCIKCTGDIVFFADQDDIWYPEKIEKMCEVFEKRPEAKVVCCKFGLVDGSGEKISGIMNPVHSSESATVNPITIESVFRKCEWPAMVLAFRREWYDGWKDITAGSKIPHDYLFCSKAADEEGFLQLDLELACHRRHDNNTAKEEHRMSVLLNKKRKLEEIDDYLKLLEAFESENVLKSPRSLTALNEKKDIMLRRRDALSSGKLGKVISNAVKDRKYVRLKTVVCDLLIVKQ